MEKLKIVLTRSMLSKDIEYICRGLDEAICNRYELVIPSDYSEDTIAAEAVDADVLLGPYVTERILSDAKRLQLIQVPWTGMDTFDFSAVGDCRVPICNTHSNADAVCELGMALTLDLLKKVSYHDRKMRSGSWNRDQTPLDLTSRMLSKQTVCILGYGNIGRRLGAVFSAFGTKVLAVDAHFSQEDHASTCYTPEDMHSAIRQADIVISCLPLTTATRGLVNEELIGIMKDGVMVVNLSRAAIVDEDALYDGLVSGKIGGFASDVWWNAPKRGESQSYPSTHNDFTGLDNVVLSPHRAGFVEGTLPHLDGAIGNIIRLATGAALECIIDVRNQY